MDKNRVPFVAASLTRFPSRRDVLRGLVGAGFGLGAARLPDIAAAKKRKKRARPNAFGCLSVGVACKSAGQCCSGICAGKQGKKRCRAHDTGTCKQDGQLVPCNNRTTCGCFRTTAGSDVCAGLFPPSACAECRRDADCLALGFPLGSACAPSPIDCEGDMDTACMVPCGVEFPDSETP